MKEEKLKSNYSNVTGNLIGSAISIVLGVFFMIYDFSMYDKIRCLADQPELAKQLLIMVPKFFGLGLIIFSTLIIIYSYILIKIKKREEDNES